LAATASLTTAPAAPAPPRFASTLPVAFHCTVTGTKNLRQDASASQICNLFQRRVDRAIARQTRMTTGWPASGNAISVTIHASTPREISAAAIIRVNRQIRRVPEITLDVMDKSAGLRDLELLADQLARAIVQ